MQYKVETTGKILPPFSKEMVIVGLADLFRLTPDKAALLLQKPVSLKSNLTAEAAEKYEKLLKSIGVDCQIVPPLAATPPSTTTPPAITIIHEQHSAQRSWRMGILVFIGTLLGSLLGVAADFGSIMETLENFEKSLYPKIHLAGSDTILGRDLGMAQAWQESFEKQEAVKMFISDVGSTNGVRLATNKILEGGMLIAPGAPADVHLLAMSAPLSNKHLTMLAESKVNIHCATVVGFDVIVFVTGLDAPTRRLSTADITKILDQRVLNWAELGGKNQQINVMRRQGSGTTTSILQKFTGDPERRTSNQIPCDSNSDCLNKTLETPGAILWESASWLKTQPDYFSVLPIAITDDAAGVSPLAEREKILDYPSVLLRPLYIYVLKKDDTSEEVLDLSEKFLRYVRSVQGQSILEEHGFFTFFRSPEGIEVELPPGFDQRTICKTKS
jgi:ABC-type phosphate transport system substrate-binding protein